MNRFRTFHPRIFLITALAAFAAGCGDTGGDSNLAEGGIRGTGSSVGPVSGFGSVFVNGTRFEFDGNVVSNDSISSESDLELGMILRIDGQWRDSGEGEADTVEYDDTLRGPLSVRTPWDAASGTAVVNILGQEVLVEQRTVLDGLTTVDLENSSFSGFVRMSGWRLADGSFRASYIGVASEAGFAPGETVELEGVIRAQVGVSERFEVGGMEVRYDGTTRVEGLEREQLVTSRAVEVEGVLVTGGATDYLDARVIRPDDKRRFEGDKQGDIEFSGPVTLGYVPSTGQLKVNGITVSVTSETELDDDLRVSELVGGVLVQVEGTYDNNGNVIASEIELRDGEAEVEGAVDQGSLDPQQRQLRVGGVLVQVTAGTIITRDDEDSTNRPGFDDLGQTGISVEVTGIERGDAGSRYLEALKIEIDEGADEGYELVGRLENVVRQSWITVLGVRLDISGNDVFDNGLTLAGLEQDLDNPEIPAPLLEVEYRASDSSSDYYIAEEIELEDEDDD